MRKNNSEFNLRIHNIINQIRSEEKNYLPYKVLLIEENSTPEYEEFISFLYEDQFRGEQDYIKFICDTHDLIIKNLSTPSNLFLGGGNLTKAISFFLIIYYFRYILLF